MTPKRWKPSDYVVGLEVLFMQPSRLVLASFLSDRIWCDYDAACEAMGMPRSTVSTQLATLRKAGYAEMRWIGGGRSQWRLTERGCQRLFDHHWCLLQLGRYAHHLMADGLGVTDDVPQPPGDVPVLRLVPDDDTSA